MKIPHLLGVGLALLVQPILSAPATDVLKKRDSRTSPPSGCLAVGPSATYKTLNSAISALGTSSTASACVFIYPGTYQERVVIRYKGPLTIYGSTTDTGTYKSNTVLITNTLNSATAGSLDNSATLSIQGDNFKLYNINVQNGYGAGAQAVAVSTSGSKQGFYGCKFTSYQDTLYIRSGTQYYSNSFIEGAVDYIFGGASAWFGECVVSSNGAGYITASSREVSTDPGWYVFDHSKILASSGVSIKGKVYLGRPWRVLARVKYQNSDLSDIINAEGWTTMAEGATPLYYEFQNTGAGASTSSRKYLSSSSSATDKNTVLGTDWTSWVDRSY